MIVQIVPHDPLVFRDGRPFSAFPGAKSRGFTFPLPQTIAGAVRGRIGQSLGFSKLSPRLKNKNPKGYKETKNLWLGLKQSVRVHGPLLISTIGEVFLPAPLDAVLMQTEGTQLIYRLFPTELDDLDMANLPHGLLPLSGNLPKGKPEAMPAFWREEHFMRWLLEGEAQMPQPEKLGIAQLPSDYRTHVALNSETQTAEEGMLYETQGLVFVHEGEGLSQVADLGLLLQVHFHGLEEEGLLKSGFFPLGGEGRLAAWLSGGRWPKAPEGLAESMAEHQAARIVLVTPAYFDQDPPYLPPNGTIKARGVRARVVAAAVGRPLTASGWDLANNRPKPSRRLVPAGSVYFLRFEEGLSPEDARSWLEALWLNPLPGQPEDAQKDGFGLAAVGFWDGTTRTLEEASCA